MRWRTSGDRGFFNGRCRVTSALWLLSTPACWGHSEANGPPTNGSISSDAGGTSGAGGSDAMPQEPPTQIAELCSHILEAPCDPWTTEAECIKELSPPVVTCGEAFEDFSECTGPPGARFTCEPRSGYPLPTDRARDGSAIDCREQWSGIVDCWQAEPLLCLEPSPSDTEPACPEGWSEATDQICSPDSCTEVRRCLMRCANDDDCPKCMPYCTDVHPWGGDACPQTPARSSACSVSGIPFCL